MNKTEEINALSSEGINSRKSDHEQNIVSLESNLKTLLDFKNSLLEDQKNGEHTIQELNEKIEKQLYHLYYSLVTLVVDIYMYTC